MVSSEARNIKVFLGVFHLDRNMNTAIINNVRKLDGLAIAIKTDDMKGIHLKTSG